MSGAAEVRLGTLQFLDEGALAAQDAAEFRARSPYPWLNPAGLLRDEAFETLRRTAPPLELFQPVFGVERAHGQRSHDRYVLEYGEGLAVSPEWHAFVRELRGPIYMRFLRRMTGLRWIRLSFHWHYTPSGCSVSPHCDNRRKIGSHIFYLNTAADWDPSWGGQTVILDDGGRFSRRSAPDFEDFDRVLEGESLGNRSLLFARRANSWHGVREIRCPPGMLRKVFIVVLNAGLWPVIPKGVAEVRAAS